jgi:DNA mismatch repair ATPase MutL
VHPAKLEVRFRQEARLSDRLRRLLQQCLQASARGAAMSRTVWCRPCGRHLPLRRPHSATVSR